MGSKTGARSRVPPDDPHAARASQEAATREPPRYAIEPDSIELECCTLEWHDDGWHHDRACLFAARRVRA
jgi:hypothetical protein